MPNFAYLTGAAFVMASSAFAQSNANLCSISVSPNHQVSLADDFAYNAKKNIWQGLDRESMISVNPKDPNNVLVAFSHERDGVLTAKGSKDQRERVSMLYRSMDGGETWQRVEFNKRVDTTRNGFSGDPGVFFNKDGSAYYYEITNNKNKKTINRIHKSVDSGKSWTVLGDFPDAVDHVQWTANTSSDEKDLKIYGLGLLTYKSDKGKSDKEKENLYALFLQTVDTDGKLEQREVTNAHEISSILKTSEYIGMNSDDFMVVNRKGKVFLPFQTWSNDAFDGGGKEYQRHWLITSEDRGKTNPPPHQFVKADGTELVSKLGTWRLGFASDNTTGPYSDRLYTVFFDAKSVAGPWRLYLSHSDDDGKIWSDPVMIEEQVFVPGQENKNSAFPIVTVNNRGVVMVSWFRDMRDPDISSKTSNSVSILSRRVMTVSLDGGKTFLPPVPLSSVYAKENNMDYMGISTGSDGRMHALWADQRLGPNLMFHASAEALCDGKPAAAR